MTSVALKELKSNEFYKLLVLGLDDMLLHRMMEHVPGIAMWNDLKLRHGEPLQKLADVVMLLHINAMHPPEEQIQALLDELSWADIVNSLVTHVQQEARGEGKPYRALTSHTRRCIVSRSLLSALKANSRYVRGDGGSGDDTHADAERSSNVYPAPKVIEIDADFDDHDLF